MSENTICLFKYVARYKNSRWRSIDYNAISSGTKRDSVTFSKFMLPCFVLFCPYFCIISFFYGFKIANSEISHVSNKEDVTSSVFLSTSGGSLKLVIINCSNGYILGGSSGFSILGIDDRYAKYDGGRKLLLAVECLNLLL